MQAAVTQPTAAQRDPGLQTQRTALAWNRTALALFANALLVLRAGVNGGRRPVLALGIALLLATAAVLLCSHWRRRQLDRADVLQAAPAPLLLGAVTGIALLACAAGAVAIVGGSLA